MTTRSLTEVFILMRNNAMHSRHIYSEQSMDDKMALVQSDPEIGLSYGRDNRLPPEWVDGLEEVQYQITRIKQMMKELSNMHDKHLHRPTLDDNTDDEQAIEMMTQDVTQMFSYCHRLVQQIRNKSYGSRFQEQRLSHNVVQSLVATLQELSISFRQSQSNYLIKIRMREERSQQYFDNAIGNGFATGDHDQMEMDEMYTREFTKEQLMYLEENTEMVQHREREVQSVVRSIADLNQIFKDLSQLVVEQGAVIDRIDYNLENSQTQVHEGLQQLQKAEIHQKKNRKMMCIIILAVVTTLLIVILIAIKS
uniref:t-SNARE coiled-coil homology domain-containing protein n=1 Tax=Strigamia maritima TaxID=126957 RepID=T1J522_STRMM